MERLFGWHSCLFPTGRSGMSRIKIADWRDDRDGPMRVISGAMGHEKVHFEAPAASRIKIEIKAFIDWFNSDQKIDGVIKAAIAHFWFVTIHPFDDGNGRIARALAEVLLVRSENCPQRFYSMSSQIQKERRDYFNTLEFTQRGDEDITNWIKWFLSCLASAIMRAEEVVEEVLSKSSFWKKFSEEAINDRQRKIINRLLDGFEGKLTSSKWAKLGKCSQDTANRDINNLIKRGMLRKNPEGGRSTSYSLD
ncbi:MAG: Fic family protein [Proteobacteria bacterium]|nr:Fic family protein [Pseudomonadota bacterium]